MKDKMATLEVYRRVLRAAQMFRDIAKETTSKEDKAVLEARSMELYWTANLLERTNEVNPDKD